MLSQHTIAGHVGQDPQTKAVGENTVVEFSVAVNNPRNRDAAPQWYRISCWNGLGETMAQYVHKGDYVVVAGSRLRASAWIDSDGNPRASVDLRADSVDFSANRRGDRAPAADELVEDIPF
jgi:single-strand DNA-binding protein